MSDTEQVETENAAASPLPAVHSTPVGRRRLKHILRVFVWLNVSKLVIAALANFVIALRISETVGWTAALVGAGLILALHFVASLPLFHFWPFLVPVKIRDRLIILVWSHILLAAGFLWGCNRIHEAGFDFAAVTLVEWIVWGTAFAIVALLVGLPESYTDQSIREEEDDAELRDARAWAVDYVRQTFEASVALLSPIYTEADLQAELRREFHDVQHVDTVHRRAKALAEKIDRYRAYENVRNTYREEAQRDGGGFSYDLIEDDVEALLSLSYSTSEVRSLETDLLWRIPHLARWHRDRMHAAGDTDDAIDSETDLEAAIEREVRSEAHPDDTEEEIEREFLHRLKRLRSTQA